MSLFIKTTQPLSNNEIYTALINTRTHALAPYSNYHVATVAEIKLKDNLYFYTSGVNIENDEHNRLGMHSEQNALAAAVTLLGGDVKFTRAWVMAAPASASAKDSQSAGKACGHCRQIMMSLAKENAEIYTVTLDGQFSTPDSFENNFLPDSFSERDLQLPTHETATYSSTPQSWKLINQVHDLTKDEITKYLQILTPHLISKHFQTSTITACIIKCNNNRYAAGVLMQDIAFLTTDAIFAAIGNAITQFGHKNLRFDEIHLASSVLYPSQLNLTEIETLSRRYVNTDTVVHFYTPDNQHTCYSFLDCKRTRMALVDQMIEENILPKAELYSVEK